MCCIHHANLDAMWGQEASIVCSTTQAVNKTIGLLAELVLTSEYPALGPFPVNDQLGYGVALAMLSKSLEPGK